VTEVRGFSNIGTALRRVVVSLLKNPFIVAILAGIAFRTTGLPLEGVSRTVIDSVSDTAIPLALIALGMSLRKYGVRGNVLPAIAIGSVKLAVMPVVVFLLARYVFDLPPIATAVAVVCAACPTGANAYLMANRFQTGLALSANAITLTTAAAVITLGAWLSLFLPG
ncbi:MAG: AEC family transporter, partial [Pseudomonadota bacterium]